MKHTQENYYRFSFKNRRGFVLPFTMLITTLILFVTTGALTLLTKQQYFSKINKQTQAAYYAADDAISCATLIDDSYTGSDGLGIFPISSTTPLTYMNNVVTYVNTRQGTSLTLADIRCGQSQIFESGGSPIFDPLFTIASTEYAYHFIYPVGSALVGQPGIEYGQTSSYNMKMDLGIDPTDPLAIMHLYRCAKVTINKTFSFRQIIAQGYSSCNLGIGSIERAVVNTTVVQ